MNTTQKQSFQFNLGHGIFLFYVCFVGVIIFALFQSFKVNHNLVQTDYYAADLNYQSRMEETNLAAETNAIQVSHDIENQTFMLDLIAATNISGNIQFYRPSDKTKDFNLPLSSTNQKVDISTLLPGKWVVKINWSDGARHYYKEVNLIIPTKP